MPAFARYPSLQDRTVLVTGGATGIGAALVEQFALQGARVGFIDIDESSAASLVTRLENSRHAPVFSAADLTDIGALDAAIARLRGQIGPIAALINNAANDQRHAIDATTPESWDAGMAVNLKHQFFAAKMASRVFDLWQIIPPPQASFSIALIWLKVRRGQLV